MSFNENVGWGARWGMRFAVVYAVIGVFVWLGGGSEPFHSTFGMPPALSIATDIAGALFAGLVLGALRPLTRWGIGAMFVGVLAVTPSVVVSVPFVQGHRMPDRGDILLIVIMSIVMGCAGGYGLWATFGRKRSRQGHGSV